MIIFENEIEFIIQVLLSDSGSNKRKADSGAGGASKRARTEPTGNKHSDSGIDDSDNSAQAVAAAASSKSFAQTPTNQRIRNEPFRRVKSEEVHIKRAELRDNSYQAFDTWGNKANADLIVTQGKSFR